MHAFYQFYTCVRLCAVLLRRNLGRTMLAIVTPMNVSELWRLFLPAVDIVYMF